MKNCLIFTGFSLIFSVETMVKNGEFHDESCWVSRIFQRVKQCLPHKKHG